MISNTVCAVYETVVHHIVIIKIKTQFYYFYTENIQNRRRVVQYFASSVLFICSKSPKL